MIEACPRPRPPAPSLVPARESLDQKYTWDLSSIFPSWDAVGSARSASSTAASRPIRNTRARWRRAAASCCARCSDRDTLGQLSYKVWYYPSLQYDEDQRNNTINARRQRVQLLIAKWQQATSWFQPGIVEAAARDRARSGWMTTPELAVYRFAIEEVFRLQEHVLNEQGEKLLSLTERLGSVPKDSYAALSTADARFPTITLSTGESTQVSYGQYRKLLATCRVAGRSATGLRGALRHLYREPQHLRGDLQRRHARRLVRGARPRLPDRRSTRRCSATPSRPAWSRT